MAMSTFVHLASAEPPTAAEPAKLTTHSEDLFGEDFGGDWSSSDGAPVRITENDGAPLAVNAAMDESSIGKSMAVTYNGNVGMWSAAENPDGGKVRIYAVCRGDCRGWGLPPNCAAPTNGTVAQGLREAIWMMSWQVHSRSIEFAEGVNRTKAVTANKAAVAAEPGARVVREVSC